MKVKTNRPAVVDMLVYHDCKGCGRCCMQENGISISPLDVLRISRYLGMSAKEFISKYCVIMDDVDVRLTTLNTISNECVFLQQVSGNRQYRCKIYDCRPMACYLYPLKMREPEVGKFYFENNPRCGRLKHPIHAGQYVTEKSGGRYLDDVHHIKLMYAVLEKYLTVPDRTEQEMLEYLYYNATEEEIEAKLTAYLNA